MLTPSLPPSPSPPPHNIHPTVLSTMLPQVRDKWSFQMTARHDLYADLFARYTRHDFQPQLVYDDHRRK